MKADVAVDVAPESPHRVLGQLVSTCLTKTCCCFCQVPLLFEPINPPRQLLLHCDLPAKLHHHYFNPL